MVNDYITSLISYCLKEKLILEEDKVYETNKLLEFLNLDECEEGKDLNLELHEILEYFTSRAVELGLIEDSIVSKDLYDTALMGLFIDRPSNVIAKFNELYRENKEDASSYFYHLNKASNYIRTDRIKNDVKWKVNTKYGEIDITINLSKPEKDPKMIAKMRDMKTSSYPKCLLCKENEGYRGRLNHPARQNIRIIPLKLDGEKFFMQYSPYVYYNEHTIVFNEVHKPMIIEKSTFKKLLDFVDFLPHYFIGSNADLPIVGGSILAHEHFQGGRYEFAMERAKSIYDFKVEGYSCDCAIVNWPLSVIRLRGHDKNELVDLADKILNKWISYSDEDNFIFAYTDDVRHNTITPIARYKDGAYELDLVLRNNITTEEYPLGYFHPHNEYHHIKKENIGLIEVMGLAVLPSRLKKEIELLKEYIIENKDISQNEEIVKHLDWVNELKKKYTFTKDNVEEILKEEIGQTFALILENAGVYKLDEKGLKGFKKFVNSL